MVPSLYAAADLGGAGREGFIPNLAAGPSSDPRNMQRREGRTETRDLEAQPSLRMGGRKESYSSLGWARASTCSLGHGELRPEFG